MINEDKDLYYLVNSKGEVIQELGTDVDRLLNNDIIVRSKVKYRGTTKLNYKYIKLNYNAVGKIYSECPQLFLLLQFVNYKDNVLRFTNGVTCNPTNVAKRLGCSPEYMMRVFRKLKSLNAIKIIREDNKNVYVLNPYIGLKGNSIYTDILKNFEQTEWHKQIEEKGKENE